MRFAGTCYRAHDPRWAFKPISGEGAAIRGARFNPNGVPTLYLAMTVMTAVKEANQGFAYRIDPCVLCSYEVDCDDIVNLSTPADREAAGVDLEDMGCAWMSFLAEGKRPPSWAVCDRCQSALNFDPLSASNIDPLGVSVSTCRPGAGPGCRGSASADGFSLRL